MSVESDIAKTFAENGWEWKLKRGTIVPSEEDVELMLDEAARILYDKEVGTQLEVGRLIVVKQTRGHDVYCFVGQYQ
jgi:hypothetical protein